MKFCALDIGNVLVHANFQKFIRQLSKALNITIEEATYFMNRTQKLHDLGLTNMSDELHDHFKIKSQVLMEELIKSWNDVIVVDSHMIDLIINLKNKHNLKVALLSNVGLEHSVRMKEVLSYKDFLTDTVKHFSCHVGARKPTAIYYHSFLQMHPEWQGCPYLDDIQENLDMGSQFGFKPFRFSLEEVGAATWLYSFSPSSNSKFGQKIKEVEKFILESNVQP